MPMIEDGKQALRSKALDWAVRLKVEPRIVRVQRMTRKWGSCSTSGIVTFAQDLVEEAPEFQDFVIAHELLHLRVPNHGKLFKALLTAHVPDWRRYEIHKRGAGRTVG
jgi:predicted metal-dependent hydrolase